VINYDVDENLEALLGPFTTTLFVSRDRFVGSGNSGNFGHQI